jgi:crotonobetainyl-CoA:carnitine CoA-transferase CaiB-like acyl-CoA transferase
MAKPLEGLTVLDFSHALAGPYCTMILAAYGADVYKIEGLDTVDMGRTWGPPFQGGEASYFLGLNSGKKALSINLKHPEGVELCLRLIGKADILIENFRPGAMSRLGLGWDKAHSANSRLIYCSVSGYGQTGPSRDNPAMDLILQASSGLISVTGTPSGELARCGHSVADITAGMNSLIGILMALRVREQSGRGQLVDVSMFDSMISAMASNFANFLGSNVMPKPLGTAFSTIVPYAAFPTLDREIAIAVASEKLWASFCTAIDRPQWIADSRFASNPLRVANRAVLEPMIVDIFRTKSAAEWTVLFNRSGIPCTPVRNMQEVVDDPQSAARDMFPQLDHASAGTIRVTGAPIKFSESTGSIDSPAPIQGQHTTSSLRHLLGLDDPSIDRLIAQGIIRQAH